MKNQEFKTNQWNKEFYEKEHQKHLDEGGSAPKEAAITNLIKNNIKNRSFRPYEGGGYYENGDIVNKYDVVVWFTWSNDPVFMVCFDHDLDCCDLVGCNTKGKLTSKVK